MRAYRGARNGNGLLDDGASRVGGEQATGVGVDVVGLLLAQPLRLHPRDVGRNLARDLLRVPAEHRAEQYGDRTRGVDAERLSQEQTDDVNADARRLLAPDTRLTVVDSRTA